MPLVSPITGSLDGLSFGTGPDADGFSIVITRWGGWHSSSPGEPVITNKPNFNGAYRGSNLRRPRRMQLECVGHSQSVETRELFIDRVLGILADKDTTYPLTRNDYTRTLSIWVELDNAAVDVFPARNGRHFVAVIPLVATDPYKYTDFNVAVETGLPTQPDDGVRWNGSSGVATGVEWDGPGPAVTGWQYQTSVGNSGVVRLFNSGTVPAPIDFTVSAIAVNPQLICIQTGETLRWGGTVSGTSVLSIKTKTGAVKLDEVDVSGLMTRNDFFKVPPNSFIDIAFSAEPGSAGAIMTARNPNVFN